MAMIRRPRVWPASLSAWAAAASCSAVGIREIAAEADVVVTTVFGHFASKEALVFAQDEEFEQRLVHAATGATPDALIAALRPEVLALVRHCSAAEAAPLRNPITRTAALREYEESMRLRHAETLAATIAATVGPARTVTACQAIARFVIDAYSIARQAADPDTAVAEIFTMIEAAWVASPIDLTSPRRTAVAGTVTTVD